MPRSRPASNPVAFHKHTGQYYVTRAGKRIYLGADRDQALSPHVQRKFMRHSRIQQPVTYTHMPDAEVDVAVMKTREKLLGTAQVRENQGRNQAQE